MAERKQQQPPTLPPWVPRLIVTVLLSIGVASASVWFLFQIRGLIMLLIVALFFSFAIEPLVNLLTKRGVGRGISTGLVMLSGLLASMVMVGLMVPLVLDQVSQLLEALPTRINEVDSWLVNNFGIDIINSDLLRDIKTLDGDIGSYARDAAGNVAGIGIQAVSVIFSILTIGLFTFYFVVDGPKLRRFICSFLPNKQQKWVLSTWEIAIDKTGGYFYSRILLGLISAVCAFVAFQIIGLPYALALAVWVGVISQFVPTVGTYIASVIPLMVALLQSPGAAVAVLIYLFIYQQIENYIFSPKITAHTMELHPAVAFGAAIAGGSIGGVAGAFLALPAAGIAQSVVTQFGHRYALLDNDLLDNTEEPRKKKH